MQSKEAALSNLVCMAEIVGVHGVRGMVKLKVFAANPESLVEYAPLCDASGKEFDFTSFQPHQNIYLAAFKGLDDRTAAEKLRGVKLYIHRDRLPQIKDKDTYYYADLIGLTAKDPSGETLGRIINVANFGSGDLLEIQPPKGSSYYVPFTNAVVPEVRLAQREATVIVPPGLLD